MTENLSCIQLGFLLLQTHYLLVFYIFINQLPISSQQVVFPIPVTPNHEALQVCAWFYLIFNLRNLPPKVFNYFIKSSDLGVWCHFLCYSNCYKVLTGQCYYLVDFMIVFFPCLHLLLNILYYQFHFLDIFICNLHLLG